MFNLKINKVISLLTAFSFLNLSVQPVLADEYMMLPPIMEESQSQNFQQREALPTNYSQNINPKYNEEVNNYQNNYNYSSSGSAATLKGALSTIPVGTVFQVIINSDVNTVRNRVGEIFTATLNQPISMDGNIIVPAGSEVIGQITYLEDAGRAGKNAKMEIKFTSIKPPYSSRIPIVGKVLTQDNTGILKGGSLKEQLVKSVKTEAVAVGSGAIVGTGIGALAGSAGAGLAVGATGAGVVGLGWLAWQKGKEVKLPVGSKMMVMLEQPFNIGK
ncbi:MAG TPA: hypothetical protein P5556_09930 [Candidatus Gastranaerophilales bacterium]|nr:hypothetical protein [Candidatus Gastranaerophilales bacterium]